VCGLPQLTEGYLTIDASDAGVILDGSQLPRPSFITGLEIVGSDGNTIRGLQVMNFTGTGLVIADGRNNTIGGDRNIGLGPTGQGNLTSDNDFGIGIWSSAPNNVVTGNVVGTDVSGTGDRGNQASGLWVTEGGANNVLGPDNIVAYNDRCGVEVDGFDTLGNTLTRNSIHDNGRTGICLFKGGNRIFGAPLFLGFDAALGSVTGTSCVGCTVELFSDSGAEGAVFEGQAVADSDGLFTIANVSPATVDLHCWLPGGATGICSQRSGGTRGATAPHWPYAADLEMQGSSDATRSAPP
jgi:hypothetical protein